MSLRLPFIVLACALPMGCGQQVPLAPIPTPPAPSSSTSVPPVSAPPLEAPPDANADLEEPTVPPASTCAADCSTTFRPGDAPNLVGRWQFCAGADEWRTWAPADTVGVEFTPPNGPSPEANATSSGDLFFLVAGPDGVPGRVNGSAYHLRYAVSSPTHVDMFFDGGGAFFANLRYSACPKELELHLMYRPNATLHVPLGNVPADPPPPPLPACTSTSAAAPAMPAEAFCAIFLATCGTELPGYTTGTECRATYAATTPQRRTCQSYHLCNATRGPAAVHCAHAAGQTVCTQSN